MKPSASGMPTPLHRRRRATEHARRLLNRQTSEETQFHHPRLLRVQHRQPVQRRIERNHVERSLLRNHHRIFEQNALRRSTPPRRRMLAGVIQQDAPHLRRRDRKKVPPAIHRRTLIRESNVGFVHQRRRLHRMLAALPPEVRSRQPVQFIVDERQQLIHCIPLTPPKLLEQASYLVSRFVHSMELYRERAKSITQ